MSWDIFPWLIEALGLTILVVWTVIPLREFAGIYRRMTAERQPLKAELEEVGV